MDRFEKLMTVEEVAAYLRVEPDTVWRLIRSGRLRAVRPGKRHLIPESAVLQYVESREPNG